MVKSKFRGGEGKKEGMWCQKTQESGDLLRRCGKSRAGKSYSIARRGE